MRIIFLGTPEFAVPTLEALIGFPEAEVVACVCQKDKKAGRGNKPSVPAVKQKALQHGIPVFQPEKLSKDLEIVAQMQDLKPDVLVMVAFGQILKKPVLEMAGHGVINLHGSLLPKYRGPAPINWAIINGEKEVGVTTMFSDAGVDTGAMLLKESIPLDPDITAGDLAKELAQIGAALIVKTLKALQANTLVPVPQDDSQATRAPMLDKQMGEIDFSKPAQDVHNLVRGLAPWPGTYTHFGEGYLKILKTKPAKADLENLKPPKGIPGLLFRDHEHIFVLCGEKGNELLQLIEVQPASKAKMTALNWANGVRLATGDAFSSKPQASKES